jgi:peptidoglycan/LPS O-acetylase OafA/YrhL
MRSELSRSSFQPITAEGQLPFIDGLRAISVLLVIVSHYGFRNAVPGGLGVTIFFFLSGFLITTLLLREGQKTQTINIPHFYVRRLLRLAPELITFIVVSAVIGAIYLGFPRVMDFVSGLFYITNYYWYYANVHSIDVRWPHLWSLAVEEHYYLTYPLLFALFWRNARALALALIAVCLLALAWRLAMPSFGLSGKYGYVATESRLDCIAYGCLWALLFWHRGEALERLKHWMFPLFLLGCALIVASFVYRDPVFRDTFRYSVQCLSIGLIFLGLFYVPALQFPASFLNSTAMVWLGRLSYGAYLWHLEPAHAFAWAFGAEIRFLPILPRLAAVLTASAVTFGLAYLSYRLVYLRFRGLRARFGSAGH